MARSDDLFERIRAQGEVAIDEFVFSRSAEELHLDFKRSSDNGQGLRLSDVDRNNLGKAISGFGNSEGGVVVWGIDCSLDPAGADIARAKVPLVDAQKFRSWLEGAVSGRTSPPHQGVRHLVVPCGAGQSGYVVTHIPQSNAAPHQMVGKMIYYIRAGSDFVPAPHAVLAGMFGRRPQPHVFHNYAIGPAVLHGEEMCFEVGLMVRNDGPGIARDLFANVLVQSTCGDRCTIKFVPSDPNTWRSVWTFGRHMSVISTRDVRLPPEAQVQPVVMKFAMAPPFTRELDINGMVGAADVPPYRFRLANRANSAEQFYDEFIQRLEVGGLPTQDACRFTSQMIGMDDDAQ